MKQFLDRLILGLPVLFLKQYPYAWIAGVLAAFPVHRAAFPGGGCDRHPVPAMASGCMDLAMRSEHAPENGRFHIDQPAIPWRMAAWKISLLLLGAAGLSFLLKGQLGLTYWQFFVMIVGFALSYQDNRFFGAEVTYIITASGIGVRFVPGHLEYCLFLPFREISRIERAALQETADITLVARTREEQEGLLMIPKDPRGFSRRIRKLFIIPADMEKFVQHLPYGFGSAI